ncbi:MAG: acryloyl-CoA reductase [Candidatus Dactylopiibacterium sp.]|nr:acryloyl-CoA reductase [Candidatus Dactylopiibacterium sp.]
MVKTVFRAYRIEKPGAHPGAALWGRFVDMDESVLDAGDVLVHVSHSAVGARDAAAARGEGVRRLPCVGGDGLAGVVVASAAPRFAPGMRVAALGHELGLAHHGGYAEKALLPGGWVLPLPDDMSARDAMAIGTAGLAAAMAITRLEENGLRAERGPVLVTGASGGVGSLAVDMLAARGYEVVALTGRVEARERLLAQGAARVMLREALDPRACEPLDRGWWAGAIDVLGGDWLGWLLATTKPAGAVASVGNVAGAPFAATTLPFARRGISLVGVDTVHGGFAMRERAWQRIAGDLRPRHLAHYVREVEFGALPDVFADFEAGLASGRTVVRLTSGREKDTK